MAHEADLDTRGALFAAPAELDSSTPVNWLYGSGFLFGNTAGTGLYLYRLPVLARLPELMAARVHDFTLRGVEVLKLFIGLGIPYLGVIGLLPWVASVDRFVLGVPFIYAWIFAWFILTSGCLMICWRVFDSRHDESHPQNR
ncbi:Protein of unknown function [Burkholderia sp. WP9]|nr:Protein of unknown function [Burkholderia sp. WP9]